MFIYYINIYKKKIVSNIRKNFNNVLKIRLDYKNYKDIQLSMEQSDCFICDNIIDDSLVLDMDFNNKNQLINNVEWADAISFNENVCDIGLTAYDNRYVDNYIDRIYNPSGDTTFYINSVSGDNYCYNIFENDNTDLDYLRFCSGFLQGFYKLEGFEYQVLPNLYTEGWTKEFWIRKIDCDYDEGVLITGETSIYDNEGFLSHIEQWETTTSTGETCYFEETLNHDYPNNEGIFYYWGVRAENKFCDFNPFESEVKFTCENVSLTPSLKIINNSEENSFLSYTKDSVCDTNNVVNNVVNEQCCKNIEDNAMAFIYTNDGEIGVRLLTKDYECLDGYKQYNFKIEEYLTKKNIVNKNVWYHITVRFKPDNFEDCVSNRTNKGRLSIFVDGMLKSEIEDFPEFVPYPHDEYKSKQLTVPYNISFGGGTQDLLEAYNFNDTSFFSGETIVNDYSIEFPITTNIVPTINDIVGNTIDVSDTEALKYYFQYYIADGLGEILVSESSGLVKVEIIGTNIEITKHVDIYGCEFTPLVSNERVIILEDNRCSIISDNFAGVFGGDMSKVRIHERSLCYHEIKCNYNLEKRKYK